MQEFFHQDSVRTMYDILQPNILSRIVPLLSDTLTKKRICIIYLLTDEKLCMPHGGKEETSQIKKETMHRFRLLAILSIGSQANAAIQYGSVL